MADQLRPVKITPDFIPHAEGSALIEAGDTRVIVTATIEDGVPSFLKGSGKGWVTGEYGMLPRSTESRTPRESSRGKQSGRTLEIQRMIGRTLRAVTDLKALGERTVGAGRQPRIIHPRDALVPGEELRHPQCVRGMALHTQLKRLQALQEQERVEWA